VERNARGGVITTYGYEDTAEPTNKPSGNIRTVTYTGGNPPTLTPNVTIRDNRQGLRREIEQSGTTKREFAYNTLGLLESETWTAGPLAGFEVEFKYDALHRFERLHLKKDSGTVQDRNRVEGADVTVAWWLAGMGSPTQDRVSGMSGPDGTYSAEGTSAGKLLTFVAKKNGYYTSRINDYNFETTRLNRWMPWNPTVELELKEIRNRVPMFAKEVRTQIPDYDGPLGFDLEEGDWVSPYGKGRVSDFIFDHRGETTDLSLLPSKRQFESTLTLTFSNVGDGLIQFKRGVDGNIMLSAHEAPEDDYEPSREWRYHLRPEGYIKDFDDTHHYYFRIRTDLDSNGNVISALYGKIYYDVSHGPMTKDGAYLRFMYYLNPDGTRNMEFDSARNLFPEDVWNRRTSRRPGP
jgi:hypothetical protein